MCMRVSVTYETSASETEAVSDVIEVAALLVVVIILVPHDGVQNQRANRRALSAWVSRCIHTVCILCNCVCV